MLKRSFDLAASFVMLFFLSPLFLLIALLIKLESPGPVFYRGERGGRNNRSFRIYKFRTMVADAARVGGPNTPRDDLRITRVGKYLRKYNLDELPQFINVLEGEMSIVGPRPEVLQYIDLFTDEEKRLLLSVRPGITDLATLWVRDEGAILQGSPDPAKTYMEKIWPRKHELQREYIERQSFWLDLKIMLLTLKGHLVDRLRS